MKPLPFFIGCLLAASAAAGPKHNAPSPKLASDVTATSVDEFRAFVKDASTPEAWTHVRQHSKTGKWNKQYFKRGPVKYDVVKTDSLVSPAKGLAEFSVEVRQSEGFDTQEEATVSESLSPLRMTYLFKNDYSLVDGAWALAQISYRTAFADRAPDPTVFTATRDSVLQKAGDGAGLALLLGKWVR
jgi:hypothetical protein